MQLEDYFDILSSDDIRIKGHRIGIETILYEYLHRGKTAEEIQLLYPTLTLEEVYATILYYLHNPEQIKKYVADWLEYSHHARCEARENPSSVAQRLRALRDEIDSSEEDLEVEVWPIRRAERRTPKASKESGLLRCL